MAEPDAVMARIGAGIALREQGERGAARDLFTQVWGEIGGEAGDPFHCCALAHSMADVQEDVHEELAWDLQALTAADLLTNERVARGGVDGSVAGFYPSLHLNLGECYRKLGEIDKAREHLDHGRASIDALNNDGYGQMITGGLDRLADRLG
ncbi:tetratricopeptide repeat protein [Rhodococcus sp. H29-C3]|uniref:tetratricopeptide repeat protein n=1 Tax=Rhodococcus sp. H29-C3 TaxID=3046307 RepID=UPI0024B8A98B|nr:tetratricopeptide repeat protein [Rhodococcus sp. H29-C3]MDJ0363455.1 tetratricopeptide repeat protein [Rhodococcus sp. H29-C3]